MTRLLDTGYLETDDQLVIWCFRGHCVPCRHRGRRQSRETLRRAVKKNVGGHPWVEHG